MRKALMLCLLMLLVTSSSIPAAEDSDPLKNKKLYSVNRSWLPRIAVDPASGAMAITWSNYHKNHSIPDKALIVFVTLKKDRFKLGKAKVVSAPAQSATIAFSPTAKQYFVAWTTLPESGWTASEIKGRFYDLKGRSVSDVFTYDNPGMATRAPMVVHNADSYGFLLTWSRVPQISTQIGYSGLYNATLDSEGNATSGPRKIRNAIVINYSVYTQEAIAGVFNATSNKTMMITLEGSPGKYGQEAGDFYLYTIDDSGKIKKRIKTEKAPHETWSKYASITEHTHSKKSIHFAAMACDDAVSTKKVTKKGGLRGSSIACAGAEDVVDVAMAYSPETDIYCIVSGGGNGLEAWFMNSSGEELTEEPVVLSASDTHRRHTVAWNPVLGKFIIVWIERLDDTNRNVWLSTLELPDQE